MPTVCINYECAAKAATLIREDDIRKNCEEHSALFALGAVGPDIFGFYDVYAREKDKWIASLVSSVSSALPDFLSFASDYAGKLPLTERKAAAAYIGGIYVYFEVKRQVYPYLASLSLKDSRKEEIVPSDYTCVTADVTFSRPDEVSRFLNGIPASDLDVISALYCKFFEKTRREIIPDGMLMSAVERLSEALTKKRPPIGAKGEYYYASAGADEAMLNEAREKWQDPFGGSGFSMLSLGDLVRYAAKDASVWIERHAL
ncbi:MAG: hypothetical protein K5629_02985 [Eubacteriales bacterium]|nr:hypothetical protein [Eubacteriales bacterium]